MNRHSLGFAGLLTLLMCISGVADEPDVTLPCRWSTEVANQWNSQQPWLVGCNFTPSTAINQLEMWQADTFDVETIDRELGWAADIGMNTVRVYLHDLLWQQDSEGFLKRIDQFLAIADKHGIKTMFVLCDSVWNPHPKLGKQPAPKPQYPWASWRREFTAEPKVWFHDVLRPDGTPHIQSEVDLIKSLTAAKKK